MRSSIRRSRGFTLIEVVVAFAILALALAALYESFGGSMRRSAQVRDRERAALIAESVLSVQRVLPPPWASHRKGQDPSGPTWDVSVEPYPADIDERSAWRAFSVTVTVSWGSAASHSLVIRSIELAPVPT